MRILYLLLLAGTWAFGQNYPVSSIPEPLKKNAKVVVRETVSDFTINAVNDMQVLETSVWTILDRSGDEYGQILIPYDKSTKVSDIKVTVYNADGKEVKTYAKKDFSDFSHSPSFGLYVDDRVLALKINATEYPFTIKYTYKSNTSNTVFIRNFVPASGFNVATEKAVRRITNRSGINLRTKEYDTDFGKVSKKATSPTLEYEYHNFPAIEREDYTPSFSNLMPKVQFALDQFHLEGKNGVLTDWNSFGKWYYQNLLTPATLITPEIKAEVAALQLTGTTAEKVRKIYQHMQEKTRYVFVAIGIGGWQPMNADDVRKKGYGDCKALTNYMRAMLDAAGIPSYYAVINSETSSEYFDADFPKMAGNHVILMVPDGDKTIWLENTSQQIAYNHLGYSTTNRNVLAVNENGIKILPTPVYAAAESKEKINAAIRLRPDGGIEGTADFGYTGGQYDFNMQLIGKTSQELSEAMQSNYTALKFAKSEVQNFKNDRDDAKISYLMNFSVNNYGKNLGSDMFFKVVPFTDFNINTSNAQRTLPFETPFAYEDDYTITYEAPAGYRFAELPPSGNITSEFGAYKIDFVMKDNKLVVHRVLTVKKGIYPKEKFGDYLEFRKKNILLDNTKVLITKI